MKRTYAFLSLLVFVAANSHPLQADGKIFPQVAIAAPPQTASQRALLHYREGTERLVIETSFTGEGTNFAWVVPLPAAPEIEAVSPDFLDAVASSFWPELVARPAPWWVFHVFLGGWLSLVLLTASRYGTRAAVNFVLSSLLLLLVAAIAIPGYLGARATAGVAGSAAAAQVLLLQRQQVGIYETATVRGTSGQVLAAWLQANGYAISTNILPVIADYAREGWVFVAAKVHRAPGVATTSRPHPLAFTFTTHKPVYPLRMTGVDNGDCGLELFVFGPAQAHIPGLRPLYCSTPQFLKPAPGNSDGEVTFANFMPPEHGGIRIGQPELLQLAAPASTATKLVGHLTPAMMRQDAYVQWVGADANIPVLHSRRAAVYSVVNWLVAPLVVGLLFVQWRWPRWTPYGRKHVARVAIAVAVAAAVVRLAQIHTAPVVETGSVLSLYTEFRQLEGAIQQFCLERAATNRTPPTIEELCRAVPAYLGPNSPQVGNGTLRNLFDQTPVREAATRGNLTRTVSPTGYTLHWHDINGVPVAIESPGTASNR